MEFQFRFPKVFKIVFLVLIGIGIISVISGFLIYGNNSRFWGNILLNNYYFLALTLGGVLFVALHAISESGWHTSIQRIPEAMGTFMPFAATLLLIMFIFGSHHLYHWTDTEHLDKILEGKKPYLNLPFFYIRMAVYFAGWLTLSYLMRKYSLMQDQNNEMKYFKRHNTYSAVFVVFFALTIVTSSWDWLMSIDAHWFSTLYGWYIFSGLLVSSISMIIIIVLLLKIAGYLNHVNKEHLHDLGKYLFAFSIFWAYLWFAQYMLIWYGNLPEETIYYYERLKEYNFVFFTNVIVNFAAPFLILMTRNSKRIPWVLGIAAIIVFIGHWIDFYQLITPGISKQKTPIGLFEAGMTLGYLGLFLFIVFRSLSSAKLVPVNHPFFSESLEYHTNY